MAIKGETEVRWPLSIVVGLFGMLLACPAFAQTVAEQAPPPPAMQALPVRNPAPSPSPSPSPSTAPVAAVAVPVARTASDSVAATDAAGAAEELPFEEPAEAYRTPRPPAPRKPLLVASFFRLYGFTGRVAGVVPHVGIALGSDEFAVDLGYAAEPSMLAIGGQAFRFSGLRVGGSQGGLMFAIFGPDLEARLFLDLNTANFFTLGSALLGFGVSGCSLGDGAPGYFVQVRGPIVHLWVPFAGDGGPVDPFFSYGGEVAAGLMF